MVLNSTDASVLDNDMDANLPNDTLIVDTMRVSGPNFAPTFTLNANGAFRYTHDDSENFTDSFTYTAMDASGLTDIATVSITINPQNDNDCPA